MNVSIAIKAIDAASAPIRNLTRTLNVASAAAKNANFSQAFGRFQEASSAALASVGKFAAVTAVAGYGFKRLFVDPAAQAERFRFQLKGLYKGDIEQTGKSFNFLRGFAEQSNFGIQELTQSFIRLEASGLNPTGGALLSLTDAAAKYGATTEQFLGVTDAISQMAAVGKIELDQLKRVAVVVPDAFKALSDEMGVSQEDMFKLLSAGKLGLPAVQALIRGLGKAAKGSGAEFSQSFVGSIGMLGDAWFNFANDVMNSGAFKEMASAIQGALSEIAQMKKDGRYGKAVEEFGKTMRDIIKSVISAGRAVYAAFTAMVGPIGFVVEMLGGFQNVIYMITGFMVAKTVVAFAQVASAIIDMAKASAVFAMTNPMLAAFLAISAVVTLIVLNIDKIKDFFGIGKNIPTFDMTSSIGIPMQSQTGIGPLANPRPIDYNRAVMRENKLFSESNINVTFDENGKPQVKSITSRGDARIKANVGYAGAKL